MNFEQAPNPETRLNENEAHDEANLIKAEAGVSPMTGKISEEWEELYGEGREATVEEYDEALKAIEELKSIVESEPASDKILRVMKTIAEKTKFGLMIALDYIPTGKPVDMVTPQMERDHQETVKGLEGAVGQLKELKKKAEELEKK
jgi:hypothetical protein